MSTELSEYELVRLENIKRNEEFLKSMGLYKDPNAPPTGVDAFRPAKRKPTRKSVLKAVKDEELEPVRRSSRNASSPGIKEEHVSLSDVENEQTQPKAKRRYDPQSAAATYFDKKSGDEEESGEYSDDDEEDGKRKREVVTPAELRAFIDNVCPEHSEMISNGAIQLCAYRCAYMTIAALKNRVRAVSTGGGKKSHEKLLVVTYAMKAMGLHRLAETAAALLKRNTGLVAVLGDGSGGSIGCGAAVSKVEDGGVDVKIEGGAEIDVKIEADCEAIVFSNAGASGSSASSSGGANSSVVFKTEPGTSIDATDTTNTGPRCTSKRIRSRSALTSIVRTDAAAAAATTTACCDDGGECVGRGSPGNVKLEPVRGPRASTSGRNSRHRSISENNESSSEKKKRQKIEETRDGKMQD